MNPLPILRALTPLGRAIIGGVILALIVAALFALDSCQSARTTRTEARLGRNQTEAAIASGTDAVAAVGKAQAGEAATDTITRENERAIRQAPGAAAPVDPAVHDAGLRGLCRYAAYRGRPECLQQPPAP